jgi:hypothetical protein
MASILCVSSNGSVVPLALRMASEGHVVRVMYVKKELEALLDGYRNPSSIPWSLGVDSQAYDLILFDSVGNGSVADSMKMKKRATLGSSMFSDRLELDDEYAKRVSLSLLPNLTSENVEDEAGISLLTEGWFNGTSFSCMNHSLIQSRLMSGNVGPLASSGSLTWISHGDRLTQQTLDPLLPLLKKVEHVGPISIHHDVWKESLYFRRFFSSLHFDTTQALSELVRGSLFDFFWNVAVKGTLPPLREDLSLSLRLSVAPYPLQGEEHFTERTGFKYLKIDSAARSHIWPSDVKWMDDEQKEVFAGVNGNLGCITGRGSTVGECRRRVYRTAENCIQSKDVQFRNDLGRSMEDELTKLKEWGWLALS